MIKDKTIFEKIIEGNIPTNKVYEDDNFLAILDIMPNSKGHTLVLPKKHFRNIFDAPDDILKNYLKVIKKISIAIKKSLNCDGVNILMNNEESAGQVIFHAHIHIIPRFKNDGGFTGKHLKYSEGEAEEIAKSISEYIK